MKNKILDLTWIGKDNQPKLETSTKIRDSVAYFFGNLPPELVALRFSDEDREGG